MSECVQLQKGRGGGCQGVRVCAPSLASGSPGKITSLGFSTLTSAPRHSGLLCKKINDSVNVCRMDGSMDGKKEGRKE